MVNMETCKQIVNRVGQLRVTEGMNLQLVSVTLDMCWPGTMRLECWLWARRCYGNCSGV